MNDMGKITKKQEKVIDAVLQAVGQWKDAGAITPPPFFWIGRWRRSDDEQSQDGIGLSGRSDQQNG